MAASGWQAFIQKLRLLPSHGVTIPIINFIDIQMVEEVRVWKSHLSSPESSDLKVTSEFYSWSVLPFGLMVARTPVDTEEEWV